MSLPYLYEYRVEYDDGRDAEIVEATLWDALSTVPSELEPGEQGSGLWEDYPDAARIIYVGRVA
jgi:hypothetical protein